MRARLWICVAAAILLPRLLAAQQTANFVPALGWDAASQGAFVTSAAVDLQGNVWAGTEGKGLWQYDVRAKKWTQFTTKDGLGDDDIYALAVDKLGRVWAGHLNHGASVWNGEKWKNYGLLDGPLGDRVFSIATCPTDGDVWIATDNGIARYSLAKDDWDYFTRAGGLPSNQIQAIAFDSNGNIFVGTQCDGIAMASAEDQYKKWKTVTAPAQMPNAPAGEGLPANLINSMAAFNSGDDQGIVAATPVGVAVHPEGAPENDQIPDWIYMRGADWKDNVNGLVNVPEAQAVPHEMDARRPLAEDWCTCFQQDNASKSLWVGHRRKGLEVLDGKSGDVQVQAGADSDADFVRAICLPPGGPPLIAISDIKAGGLMTLDNSKAGLQPGDEPPKTAPPLPGLPKPTDAATLITLVKQLDVFKNQIKPGDAVFLGDDWRTQGDWVGRYGNAFAMICGLGPSGVFQLLPDFDVSVGIGPHNAGAAAPVAYVAKDTSTDLRTLYNPALGHRSEAEFNDISYADTYPPAWEGPDLWVDVKVPAGVHCLSLYFVNNDSQDQQADYRNKLRDYDLQVLPWAGDKDAVQKAQPIARARVTDFRGGVYKMFIVAGPARYIVRVGRNRSFVTKLQGVFIDQLIPDAPGTAKSLPGFDSAEYGPPDPADVPPVANNPVFSAAGDLWDFLDKAFDKRGVTGLQLPLRIITYRAAVAANAPEAILAGWRWQMGIWTKEDRAAYDKAMADAYQAFTSKAAPANQDDN